MTKVLVREHNAPEELTKLQEFLSSESQKIVVLDEENPATSGLQEDDLPEITWFIHKGGDIPSGLYSVVITDDGQGADGADVVVMKDDFSPTMLVDQIRASLEKAVDRPLLQLEEGYVTGDLERLEFHTGVAPAGAEDPAGVLAAWRERLRDKPEGDAQSAGTNEETQEEERVAVPVINTGLGW